MKLMMQLFEFYFDSSYLDISILVRLWRLLFVAPLIFNISYLQKLPTIWYGIMQPFENKNSQRQTDENFSLQIWY